MFLEKAWAPNLEQLYPTSHTHQGPENQQQLSLSVRAEQLPSFLNFLLTNLSFSLGISNTHPQI